VQHLFVASAQDGIIVDTISRDTQEPASKP
jgi:hypothetical protein